MNGYLITGIYNGYLYFLKPNTKLFQKLKSYFVEDTLLEKFKNAINNEDYEKADELKKIIDGK